MTYKPRQISGNDPIAAISKDYNRYCDRISGDGGNLFLSLGAELVTSFINGLVSPLSTFTTSGNDITSAIALAGDDGCVADPLFPILTGDRYLLTIDNLNILASTANGLGISIVNDNSGGAVPQSNELVYNSVGDQGAIAAIITVSGAPDVDAYLQFKSGAASTVSWTATGVSLKKIL
jgi:hypothetical protein